MIFSSLIPELPSIVNVLEYGLSSYWRAPFPAGTRRLEAELRIIRRLSVWLSCSSPPFREYALPASIQVSLPVLSLI